MKARRSLPCWTLAAALCLAAGSAGAQQDLGHKVLGTLGLQAGSVAEPGVYVADRVLFFSAGHVVDREGNRLPIALDLDAFANGIGVGGAAKIAPLSTYVSAGFGIPVAHVTINSDRPEASIDRFGLGDLFVQPLKLGWRLPRLDLVTGYAFYAPTGRFSKGGTGGVGRGYWTHEVSAGGTFFFNRARTWHLSALGSYDFNQRMERIDVTRGDTFQIQGGLGTSLFRFLEAGVAFYAEWQVTDDRGADLPAALRGLRERTFGLGPEIGALVAPLRSKLFVRYEHDLVVRSRAVGQVFVAGLTVAIWKPVSEPPPRSAWRDGPPDR
ncbi:SphA family protein [Vulgatibacter incomptus]|uniref:Protein involved in meta-pathway of phenol degradation n=1 Tax=Vulgatibacter incomptus TaxID=1391653 RepID=A0A0K1PJJ4_9BACT|nr:transporter [Vulgatibacter incomptus]AKU93264.1 Protein involved in meta-pathway of phenol degradation [Vulgatibacter incomptus]